jgi:hypothetical protein
MMSVFRLTLAAAFALALAAMLMLTPQPAGALDLFARHEVNVQFATPDGTPMADAEVRVFAPGKPDKPALTGRTDKNGRFEFPASTDGFWNAEARSGKEIARVTIRIGGSSQAWNAPVSPYWILGGLFLLLILAFAFRVMRARARRPPR